LLHSIDNKIEYQENSMSPMQKDPRHIKIIKQLCSIVNEEFVAITAGDKYNIYNKSWFFKTDKNYYYMIEKENIVTLYNSFTKKEVTKARLVTNQTKGFTFSNFIAQMLA